MSDTDGKIIPIKSLLSYPVFFDPDRALFFCDAPGKYGPKRRTAKRLSDLEKRLRQPVTIAATYLSEHASRPATLTALDRRTGQYRDKAGELVGNSYYLTTPEQVRMVDEARVKLKAAQAEFYRLLTILPKPTAEMFHKERESAE